ncbi:MULTISPECIES: hypothetical protein [Bacillus]|uniref:hypothetical protein n=1 Tax=Bacillus TaxID=1386 RepID=UPI0012FF409E|nr:MULTISPECIES: hypothetical protein [Bacillus]
MSRKKHFYQKWWFWTIVLFIGLNLLINNVMQNDEPNDDRNQLIESKIQTH